MDTIKHLLDPSSTIGALIISVLGSLIAAGILRFLQWRGIIRVRDWWWAMRRWFRHIYDPLFMSLFGPRVRVDTDRLRLERLDDGSIYLFMQVTVDNRVAFPVRGRRQIKFSTALLRVAICQGNFFVPAKWEFVWRSSDNEEGSQIRVVSVSDVVVFETRLFLWANTRYRSLCPSKRTAFEISGWSAQTEKRRLGLVRSGEQNLTHYRTIPSLHGYDYAFLPHWVGEVRRV